MKFLDNFFNKPKTTNVIPIKRFKLSTRSKNALRGCHLDLQRLVYKILEYRDCSVVEGRRDISQQLDYVKRGLSKTKKSKHLLRPSEAVHLTPYPMPGWKDYKAWYEFGGFVRGLAKTMGIKVRWGGDWDGDFDIHDQTFNDLMHYELE